MKDDCLYSNNLSCAQENIITVSPIIAEQSGKVPRDCTDVCFGFIVSEQNELVILVNFGDLFVILCAQININFELH